MLASVLLISALAGCAKPEQPLQEQQIAPGSITGTVTDVALLPLVGANVTVDGTNLSALTDATGAFHFDILPGEYVVLASLAEHRTAALRASVSSGQASALAFQLEPIPRVVPYSEVQEAEGYIACTALVVRGAERTAAPCGENDPNERASVEFPVSSLAGLEGIVLEVVWEARSAAAGTMRVDAFASADGTLSALGATEGASPVVLRIPGRLVAGQGLVVTVGPAGGFTDEEAGVDAGVVVQQPFTAYASLFYHEDAPAGYSATQPDAL